MGRNGTNKDLKKIEGTDRYEDRNCRRGRQAHQSLKAYWILQYLINNATEKEPVSIGELINELDDRGINTDRKSIYRDIREINIINYMLEDDEADVFDAEEAIDNDVDGLDRLVLYDRTKKGYYVSRRNYDETDIQLIVESIYSSRFLTEKQSERLANIACRVISEGEATNIKHQVALLDRRKTNNKQVLRTINTINEAMADMFDGEKKKPCQISFDEVGITVTNGKPQKVRTKCVGSPHYMAIYDGEYYLIYYAKGIPERYKVEGKEKIITATMYNFFAIELSRIENVTCLYDEPLLGKEEFEELDESDVRSLLDGTYHQELFLNYLFPQESKMEPVTLLVTNQATELLFDDVSGEKDYLLKQVNEYWYYYSKVFNVDNHFFDFVIENYPDIIIGDMSENRQKDFAKYIAEKYDKFSRLHAMYKDGIDLEKVVDEFSKAVDKVMNDTNSTPLEFPRKFVENLNHNTPWKLEDMPDNFRKFFSIEEEANG